METQFQQAQPRLTSTALDTAVFSLEFEQTYATFLVCEKAIRLRPDIELHKPDVPTRKREKGQRRKGRRMHVYTHHVKYV